LTSLQIFAPPALRAGLGKLLGRWPEMTGTLQLQNLRFGLVLVSTKNARITLRDPGNDLPVKAVA
jgi:hypothetical protein